MDNQFKKVENRRKLFIYTEWITPIVNYGLRVYIAEHMCLSPFLELKTWVAIHRVTFYT